MSWNTLYLSDLLTKRSEISPKKTPQRRHRRLGCLNLEVRNQEQNFVSKLICALRDDFPGLRRR